METPLQLLGRAAEAHCHMIAARLCAGRARLARDGEVALLTGAISIAASVGYRPDQHVMTVEAVL